MITCISKTKIVPLWRILYYHNTMSKATLIEPLESLQGKLHQQSNVVFRRKTVRDEQGHIVHVGPQESYRVIKPRDREKNPPSPAEQRNIDLFAAAVKQAAQELSPDSPKRTYWEQRWRAQLTKGEPITNDIVPKRRKIYHYLHPFVRATILAELKQTTAEQ